MGRVPALQGFVPTPSRSLLPTAFPVSPSHFSQTCSLAVSSDSLMAPVSPNPLWKSEAWESPLTLLSSFPHVQSTTIMCLFDPLQSSICSLRDATEGCTGCALSKLRCIIHAVLCENGAPWSCAVQKSTLHSFPFYFHHLSSDLPFYSGIESAWSGGGQYGHLTHVLPAPVQSPQSPLSKRHVLSMSPLCFTPSVGSPLSSR